MEKEELRTLLKEEGGRIFADERRFHKFKQRLKELQQEHPEPKAKAVKKTYKGKSCRVQLMALTLPGRPTRFIVSTLPASAKKHTPFTRGKIEHSGREFPQAWVILCSFLEDVPKSVPRSLSEYAKKGVGQ